VLSRTAESLFWIGRYLERVQGFARALDTTYHARLERLGASASDAGDLEALLDICGERERFEASSRVLGAAAVARFTLFESDNPSAVLSCLRQARENARGMRDRITSEMWETLNSFYLWLATEDGSRSATANLHDLCEQIKTRCHLFTGVAQGTMVHDEGWNFLRAGTYLERAAMTARLLAVQFPRLLPSEQLFDAADLHAWIWLLRSVSGYEAYCQVHHLGIRPELVADFLVFDRDFPRSIRYAIGATGSSLRRISNSQNGQYANDAERLIGLLEANLTYADRRALSTPRLLELLAEIPQRCFRAADALGEAYFTYAVPGAIQAR
jgi:uncharacterized alpha-E superfamily protein